MLHLRRALLNSRDSKWAITVCNREVLSSETTEVVDDPKINCPLCLVGITSAMKHTIVNSGVFLEMVRTEEDGSIVFDYYLPV